MEVFNGKILKAGAYPLKEVDKYGNTHRHAIQVGEKDWITFGSSKLDNFMVKDADDKWQVLGPGSEVVIKYTVSGDFKNAKKADLMVINLVPGEKYESNQPAAQSTGTANKSAGINPAERGQIMNLAIQEFGSVKAARESVAAQWVHDFYKFQEHIGDCMTQPPFTEKSHAPAPKQEEDTSTYGDFDDDVPF